MAHLKDHPEETTASAYDVIRLLAQNDEGGGEAPMVVRTPGGTFFAITDVDWDENLGAHVIHVGELGA